MPTINQLPLRSPVSPGDQIPIYSPNNGDARRTPISAVADLIVNGLDLPNTAVLLTGDQTVGGTKTFSNAIVGSITGNAGTVTNGVYTTGNQTIGGTKTFSNAIVGDITGNAGSVTNGVYTTGNQTIGGTKTFSSTIVGDITGNAGSVTNGVYTTGNQTIGGTKTFSSAIVGDVTGNAGTVTNGVYTTGNQTIGGTKTFSSTIVGDISGNAGTVTGGVYTTGNQTIGGTKTFTSTIVGDISGNAGTVTNGVYTTGNQTIGGTKTFSLNPILSAGTANTVLVLDGSKQIAAASGLGYNATTRTLTLGVGDTPDFRIGRGASNVSTNTAVGANSLVANTTGFSNTAFGNNVLFSNTTGPWNTAIGDGALYGNIDAGNLTAIGFNALYSGGGNGLGTNTAVGANSLRSLTTGYDNTAVGADSLRATTTGRWNVAIGERALRNSTTGTWNIAVGSDTLLNTSTGPANIAIGASALSANTTGSSNVAVGHNALTGNTTGAGNTSVGAYTQSITRTGSRNITIGYASGELITTGSNNSILGSFDGNQHGIDIRTASNNIVLSDGLGVPRAYYNATASTWDFRTGASPGTVRLTIGDSAVTISNVLSLAAGTALLPSLAATGDLDTGMWFPAANTVAWSTGGTERMRITSAGEVGIGTSTPTGSIPLTILANSSNAIALNIRGRSDGIGVLLFSDNSDVENGRLDFRTNYAEIKQARNAPLVFSTNSSEKMRLTAAGDLGLGTTPGGGMKLDILGGNVNLTNATYAAYQVVSGAVTGQLAANASGSVEVRAVSNHPLLLYTNNAERVRITSTGNVGIGTSAPAALLDVGQTGGTTVIRSLQADSGAGTFAQILAQKASGPGVEMIVDTAAGYVGTAGAYPLVLRTNSSERMRINAAGEVGIGKTAASGIALDVNGIIHGGERMQLTNGFANVSMLESASGVGYRWTLVSGTGTFRLQRSANGTYSDATTPIIFDASNNVGIGTTSPAVKLEVAGQIRTEAPTGGTAANWRLGTVHTVSPTSPNRTIEVDIGGTIYYLHAKTTND